MLNVSMVYVIFICGVFANKMAADKLPWGLKSKSIAPGSMKVFVKSQALRAWRPFDWCTACQLVDG